MFAFNCDDRTELSEIQQAIWYDQIARPQSPVYNIGGRLMIYGPVNYGLLKQALQRLVNQNQALRLGIDYGNGLPRQFVRPHIAVELPFIDMSGHVDPQAAAADWLQDHFRLAFTIGEDAVYWQFALLKISNRQYALLTKYHHLIADGWSTKIVIDRLAELYNALLAGSPCPVPEAASYLDFVAQEQQYIHSALFERDAEFWRLTLPDLPEPLIRHKYALGAPADTTQALSHRFCLERAFYNRLTQWASEHQATTYHVLLSALCLYFARTQRQTRFTVGIPVLNRSGARFKKVLGLFASLSPLVIDIELGATPQQLLRYFSFEIRKLHKHQRYPLTVINQRLQLLKNKRDSLFDLVMSYEKQDYTVRFGEAEVNARQLFSGAARYPLAATVCEFNADDAVEVIFEGAETCFNAEELALVGRRLQFVLQQFIDTPDKPLAEIDLLPEDEKQFIFHRFNRPQPAPSFNSVIAQFKYWVALRPDRVAIKQLGRELTYRELDQLSDQLGHELCRRNCEVGDVVAVCMPRCIESIVSMLAILKMRAVYLPIDSDSPADRIHGILQQSQAVLLLTVTSEDECLSALHDNTVWVDRMPESFDIAPLQTVEPKPDDLAYIIYTSGSTGQPKGSKIHHLAMSVRLAWLQKAFAIRPEHSVGQSIQTHFDPSLVEILLALTQGACLVLAPWQRLTAEAIAEFVLTEQIHALALVPSSLRLLLQGLPASGAVPLKVACCGGETLPANLAKAFIQRTGARLFNVYGPTETTILASAWACAVDDQSPLPLGQPLDQTQILIVDSQLRLMPVAVPGEIVIGGAGVGKGYLRQETETAQAFVANPYAEGYLYRSGDVGYIGTDGQLYFSERLDRQVKISGYRIELGEIENVLMQHDSVRRAAVDVMLQHEQKILLAYVEADSSESLSSALLAYLRQRLPDYMLPRVITILDALPLTAVGKIAYQQLPLPNFSAHSQTKRPPATALETRLLNVWQRTLNNPDLGVDDNFFEQDADSLTAISLLTAIESATGHRCSIGFLMAYPSVAMQSEQLAQTEKPVTHAHLRTLSKQISPVHLYVAASGEGDQMRFQALADALGESCTVHMLSPQPVQLDQASIETIAGDYARVIREHAHDNFYLAGFSIGGITALEAARQLQQQRHAPRRLILLDTVYPHWPLQSPWLLKLLQWLSGRLILNRITLNDRKLQAMLTDPGIIVQLAGLNRHLLRPFQGEVLLIMTDRMRYLRRWLYAGWFKLFGDRLETDHVPGMHGAMFQTRYLPELCRVIRRYLKVD